ncbi:MAG: hypothetical protein HQM01_13940 [Magnetococcales bacterium]|nr:hypothetical protein [Magnetococcales bacterium]
MNHLRLLLLAALAVFLVNGLLSQHESDTISSDTLFTLAFLGYIWHVLRRNKGATPPGQNPSAMEQTEATTSPPPSPATPAPAPASVPTRIFLATQSLRPSGRIIQHKLPWSVVEQGKPVGQFRHAPIPAWIRTSDNRHAEYVGIALAPPPDGCVCLEIPDQSELILPPGLIYAIRS